MNVGVVRRKSLRKYVIEVKNNRFFSQRKISALLIFYYFYTFHTDLQ